MTTNPFNLREELPVMERNYFRQYATDGLREATTGENLDPFGPETAAPHPTREFINGVYVATAMLLVLVFSVFREIHHNGDLYRLSQMVASSEAQTRQWQERLRLEEAREASLLAELQSQPFLARNLQFERAGRSLPN